ncbi:MAG: hypothetical protein Fur0014_21570 [Rubrivivax sp.]
MGAAKDLADLEDLSTDRLAQGLPLLRVQRSAAIGAAIVRGPLHLPPIGSLSGRFDLAGVPCAYLAEAPDTALFEALFRRESTGVSVAALRLRRLPAVQTRADLVLGDLRPHATAWPALQSLRFSETQAIWRMALANGQGAVNRWVAHAARPLEGAARAPSAAPRAAQPRSMSPNSSPVSFFAPVASHHISPIIIAIDGNAMMG